MIELSHLDCPVVTVNASYDKERRTHTCNRWMRRQPLYNQHGAKRVPQPGEHLQRQEACHSGSVRVGEFESRQWGHGEPGIDVYMSSLTKCALLHTL